MEPRPELVPNASIGRLSLYLRQLEIMQRQHCTTISSKQLGDSLHLTDAQVRKDFAYFGQFGHAGVGYRVDDLILHMKRILGTDKMWNVLLVGAGHLGQALLAYNGFAAKSFRLIAVFDDDPAKIGKQFGPLTVQPMTDLPRTVADSEIHMGIIAVPADNAQNAAEELVQAGIRGILNFAPVSLDLPSNIAVNSVDLAVQLEQLSFRVTIAKPASTAAP